MLATRRLPKPQEISRMYTLANGDAVVGLYFGAAMVGVAFVAGIASYYIVKLIVDGVRKSQATKLESQARENQDRLKSLMIQRGISAEEIERILSAEGSKPDFTEPTPGSESRIVEVLSGNGYGAADIERILIAARSDRGEIPPAVGNMVETLAENWAKAADIERMLQTRRKPATA
jgi:hypothetical protein